MGLNTPAFVDGGTKTMPFAADTEPYVRVVPNSSGEAAIAGATVKSIGVSVSGVDISESVYGTVRLPSAGTVVMIASKAIAAGDIVYSAAAGKITDVSTSAEREGIALSAAAADGDLIEVAMVA